MKVEQARSIVNNAIEEFSQALERGHSETLRKYLEAVAMFHRYSLPNIILIALQRPNATQVPAHARKRLVAAAASLFNRAGYHGTDSNRIAKKAGYSTGIFYKHFKDKREIFLAAYETWVASECQAVAAEFSAGGAPDAIARRLVTLSIDFHTRWRGLRASLQELVFADAEVSRFYRKQRRRQLDVMRELRASIGAPPRSREEDAIHLFTTERTFDAIARGELRDLGLDREVVIEAMIQKVISVLS